VAGAAGLTADDVLITSGAAGALFIVATSLLEPGDHLVVVRPNYATNLHTPRAIGCEISCIDLRFEDGYQLDPDAVAAAITPRTKLISVTCPHNPTGVMLNEAELRQLAELAAGARLPPVGRRDLSRSGLRGRSANGRLARGARDRVSSLSKAYESRVFASGGS
jgi:histidinol-phosphate/aromatic aminotransferase/cobyric acid decarboxylase-like protein